MICNEARELLQPHADGELEERRRVALEEHLAACPSCADLARALRENVGFLRDRLALLAGRVRPDLSSLAALPAKPPPAPGAVPAAAPRRRVLLAVPALAILAGVAFLAWEALRGEGGDGPEETARVAETSPEPPRPERPPPPPEPPSAPAAPAPGEPEPYRPVPVRPGLAQLLPRLLAEPLQRRLDRCWEAMKREAGASTRVLRLLGDSEDEKERALLALLLAAGNREAREELLVLLASDGSPLVRTAAAAALGRVEGGGAGKALALDRLSVTLGVIEDEELRRRLLDQAESERDPRVLAMLVRIVAPSQERDPTISARLADLARIGDPEVRDAALEAIRLARPKDIGLLASLVEDRGLPLAARAALLDLLPGADPARGGRYLLRVLRTSPEEALRLAALEVLSRHPDQASLPVIVRLLRSGESSGLRSAALGALAAHRTREVLEILREVAEADPDRGIREAAKAALRGLEAELDRGSGKDR